MVVGRFQVIALLQAARAEVLGLSEESALSWGLNRAIFYAAAKRGFRGSRGKVGKKKEEEEEEKLGREEKEIFRLGDEIAFTAKPRGRKKDTGTDQVLFEIGGATQTERDFARQIRSRFTSRSYEDAWKESLDIIKRYDRAILESGREFFDEVYKPRRDTLAKKWTDASTSA